MTSAGRIQKKLSHNVYANRTIHSVNFLSISTNFDGSAIKNVLTKAKSHLSIINLIEEISLRERETECTKRIQAASDMENGY